MQNRLIDDRECIAEWRTLISAFNKIADDKIPVDQCKEKLLVIKEQAKSNKALTYHQVDAIAARVDNYIAGTYGKSKTKANLEFQNKGQ